MRQSDPVTNGRSGARMRRLPRPKPRPLLTPRELEVLTLVGSGLSALDVLAFLEHQHFEGKITLVSRHGLLPLAHEHPFQGTKPFTADEMKTVRIWHRALKECGFDEDGMPINLEFPMSSWLLKDKRGFMKKFFFFWPFLIVWIMIMIIHQLSI